MLNKAAQRWSEKKPDWVLTMNYHLKNNNRLKKFVIEKDLQRLSSLFSLNDDKN